MKFTYQSRGRTLQRIAERAGVKIFESPTDLASITFQNTGEKLVLIQIGGKQYFLEPGEHRQCYFLELPFDMDGVSIEALNNGL
jgi:hypothetical protein